MYIHLTVCKQKTYVELILNKNNWHYITVCKQMRSIYKLFAINQISNIWFVHKSYIFNVCIQTLALNYLQWLICHKLNQKSTSIYIYIYIKVPFSKCS